MAISIFFCGDVMTGRGIDQIMPNPGDPQLFESYVKTARQYVQLAESAHGAITQPVSYDYIWSDVLDELERRKPDVRIINLETAITQSGDYWPRKQVHYRMNPQNISCLTAAKINCCTLANNHLLDWGYEGLAETLKILDNAGIRHAGAGIDVTEAQRPSVFEVNGKGRVLVFSFGSTTSSIPLQWAARKDKPGINLLPDLSEETAQHMAGQISQAKSSGDVAIASIHWGGNWGYEIPQEQVEFAHCLIEGGVDIVHGHSSHHFKAVEIYRGRPIFYGCGDFINDYEGIGGHEEYRGDLAVMYFVTVDPSQDKCVEVRLVPMQIKHFRLNRASDTDAQWMYEILKPESAAFDTKVDLHPNNSICIRC